LEEIARSGTHHGCSDWLTAIHVLPVLALICGWGSLPFFTSDNQRAAHKLLSESQDFDDNTRAVTDRLNVLTASQDEVDLTVKVEAPFHSAT
jgi:hypothetical protein